MADLGHGTKTQSSKEHLPHFGQWRNPEYGATVVIPLPPIFTPEKTTGLRATLRPTLGVVGLPPVRIEDRIDEGISPSV